MKLKYKNAIIRYYLFLTYQTDFFFFNRNIACFKIYAQQKIYKMKVKQQFNLNWKNHQVMTMKIKPSTFLVTVKHFKFFVLKLLCTLKY